MASKDIFKRLNLKGTCMWEGSCRWHDPIRVGTVDTHTEIICCKNKRNWHPCSRLLDKSNGTFIEAERIQAAWLALKGHLTVKRFLLSWPSEIQFGSQSQVYNDFLYIMKEFGSQSIAPSAWSPGSRYCSRVTQTLLYYCGLERIPASGLQIVYTPPYFTGPTWWGPMGYWPSQGIPIISIQPVMSLPVSVRPVTAQSSPPGIQ